MREIKIAVACHKPSELPKNRLFVPVHVGAELTNSRIKNTSPDNSGENISTKNPSYCELTAQYWLWKNEKADYYGLCHYRRFLCFEDVKAKRDLRNQISASILDEESMRYFGLDDEKGMRKIIENNDVVIGEEQYVPRLYTPHGNQRTAYEHWVAHDRALIKREDLDLMLDILNDVSPKIGKAARQYLNGSRFLGFNCFVLRSDLFDELCEIEFETLGRLEKKVDTSTYCQQLSRIYGFMGEIISSSYFYYLEKSRKYRIKRVPLVYFSYTDVIDLKPIPGSIPIIFNAADLRGEYFGVQWKSFLDNIDSNYKYDVNVLIEDANSYRHIFTKMAEKFKNVSLRFVDAAAYRDFYGDKYHLKNDNKWKNKEDILNHFSLLPFIPYIFKDYDRAIVIGENNIFRDDIHNVWKETENSEKAINAPKDIFIISLINDIYVETAELKYRSRLKSYLDIFSTNFMVWDLKQSREKITEETIAKTYRNKDKTIKRLLLDKSEVMNIVYEDNFDYIDQRYNALCDSNLIFSRQLPYAPLTDFKKLIEARRAPVIMSFLSNDPWEDQISESMTVFWEIANTLPFREIYQRRGIELAIYRNSHSNTSVTTRLFPVDGIMRGKLTKILPPGSKRSNAIKKILSRVGLR